jgi:hypothetical protein
MQTEVSLPVVLPGGVRLDTSNYIEVDDRWLARAAERINQEHRLQPKTALPAPNDELNA